MNLVAISSVSTVAASRARRAYRLALPSLVVALLLSAGAATAAPPGSEGLAAALWPMLGASPRHGSLSTFLGPNTNQLAWRLRASGMILGGAAVDTDGTVFFGAEDGSLYAVDQTGALHWRIADLGRIIGVPALARGNKLYVGTSTGKVYAVDMTTGAILWSYETRARITTSPAVGPDGNVYVGTRAHGLVALTPLGAPAWSAPVKRIKGSSPAVGPDGTIYVATSDGRVYALTPDGAIVWQQRLGGGSCSIVGSLALRGDRIYVGAADGFLRALDRGSGALVWAFDAGAPIRTGVSLGPDGAVVFAAGNGKVFSIVDQGAQGQLRWAKVLGAKILSTPAVDRTGAVFIGSNDRKIYALEGASGAIRWSLVTAGTVRSAVAIGLGGRVLVGSADRSFYAIGEFRAGADCWSTAFIDVDGLSPEEATKRFQILLAACGGPDVNSCAAFVQGSINADRFIAAQRIAAQLIDPAQYLAIVRDRTRKYATLAADAGAHFCDVLGKDEDGDYVPDALDACPGTPPLTPTHDDGCTDSTLPAAPPANLVHDGLAALNLLFDAKCDETVPEVPSLEATVIEFSGLAGPITTKKLTFAFDDNQKPGCGVFIEMEVVYQRPDGTIEAYSMVYPRPRGHVEGPRTVSFTTNATDPGLNGAFTSSRAFVHINNIGAVTRYRLRATNYAGVHSLWGPLICDSCPTER